MRPTFIKRSDDVFEESFTVNFFKDEHFSHEWHHHLELELIYIVKSKGVKYVGEEISGFRSGDLYLVGSQTPHMWLDRKNYDGGANVETKAEAIVVHFRPDFLGAAIQNRAELLHIYNLIDRATRGITFLGASKQIVQAQLQDLLVMNKGLDRLILLLKILSRLSKESSVAEMSTTYNRDHAKSRDRRLDLIQTYVMNGFRQELSAAKAAQLLKMNPNAFSRFFAAKKGVDFTRYVNKMRVGFAKELLATDQMDSVLAVANASGFNNLSNFNVQFKKHTGTSPVAYMKSIMAR